MDQTPNNPPTNRLPEGVDADTVMDAVTTSGYPLQTVVAADMRRDFNRVQEEWSYLDKDSDGLRTLDVLATKRFSELPDRQPRTNQLASGLTLLMECKRSELPYVFFLSSGWPQVHDFPLVVGLPKLELSQGNRRWLDMPIAYALGLDQWDFVARADYCMAFAKTHRKGKGLILSGSEPFNNLVLPLSKALDYYESTRKAQGGGPYYCYMTIGVAVLDAPMVGVRISGEVTEPELLPWVRVVRHETREDPWKSDKLYAVDVVHKDYLREYLSKHLFPVAERFARLAETHHQELTSGEVQPAADSSGRLMLPY